MSSPFSARDLQRLEGVHPDLISKLGKVFAEMQKQGHAMFVVMGVRTAEQQHELWRQGRETPGKIVTNRDGYHSKSNHQPHSDGYGHAVDCAFVVAKGSDPFDEKLPWLAYCEAGEAEGLVSGYRWKQPHDGPHLELA